MKKRVTYLDLAKGIGIILVVLGHMENINAGLRTWISSFHMPLFFVISGMLIALKKEDLIVTELNSKEGLKQLIAKKARGILIPYAWFSLIYVPIDIMNLYIDNVDSHTFVQNILDSLTFSGISVMWFLPALFIAEIASIYVISFVYNFVTGKDSVITDRSITEKKVKEVEKRTDNKKLYLLIMVCGLLISLISFFVWNSVFRKCYEANASNYLMCTLLGFVRVIFRGLAMSSHVLTGYVMFRATEYIDSAIFTYINKRNKDNKMSREQLSQVIGIVSGVIFFALNLGFYMKNGDVDNHFLTVSNMPLYYLCAFLGSMSIILISRGFDSIKPIDFLGRNSLVIMATHLQCYILYAGILIAIAIDAYVTRAKSYVYMFNSVLFTMLIETVVIIVINKFFPFIIGKGTIKSLIESFKNKD